MKNSKIKLMFKGHEFIVNAPTKIDPDGESSVNLHAVQSARIIRQFIKKEYGSSVKSSVRTQKYAGGSSVRIYLNDIDKSSASEISEFSKLFQAGNFNGMDDSYEYKDHSISDKGSTIKMYTSYVFTYLDGFLI